MGSPASSFECGEVTAQQLDQYYALLGNDPHGAECYSGEMSRRCVTKSVTTKLYGTLNIDLKPLLEQSHTKEKGLGTQQTCRVTTLALELLRRIAAGTSRTAVENMLQKRLESFVNSAEQAAGVSLTVEQASDLARFFAQSMLKPYPLLLHVFTNLQKEECRTAILQIEVAAVPPLSAGLPETAWAARKAAQAAAAVQAEAAKQAAEAARRALEEAARHEQQALEQERARQSRLQQVPSTFAETVELAVALRMVEMEKGLEAEQKAREAALVVKLHELEAAAMKK